MPISDEMKDKVVALYKQGAKTQEITDQTGVPRPTIYWVLEQRGVKPSRNRPAAPEVNVDQVLERLSAAEREIGRLQEMLARAEALNEALMTRLGQPAATNGG